MCLTCGAAKYPASSGKGAACSLSICGVEGKGESLLCHGAGGERTVFPIFIV